MARRHPGVWELAGDSSGEKLEEMLRQWLANAGQFTVALPDQKDLGAPSESLFNYVAVLGTKPKELAVGIGSSSAEGSGDEPAVLYRLEFVGKEVMAAVHIQHTKGPGLLPPALTLSGFDKLTPWSLAEDRIYGKGPFGPAWVTLQPRRPDWRPPPGR